MAGRRRHEQEAEANDEAVGGKGNSAGEATSAATHAIAAAACDARGLIWAFPSLRSERRAPYPLRSEIYFNLYLFLNKIKVRFLSKFSSIITEGSDLIVSQWSDTTRADMSLLALVVPT